MPRPLSLFLWIENKTKRLLTSPILQIENDHLPRPFKFCEVLNRGREFTWRNSPVIQKITLIEQSLNTHCTATCYN